MLHVCALPSQPESRPYQAKFNLRMAFMCLIAVICHKPTNFLLIF